MERNTLVVNLFGGPGSGKSTTTAGVFTLLKLAGIECELALEYAKDLIWEERHKTLKDQQYVFAKQNHRLWRVKDRVDVAITDNPLILSVVYGRLYDVGSTEFYRNVVDTFKGYNNLNILLNRVKPYNPNGRNQNEEEAKDIDDRVRGVLNEYGMSWEDVPGDHNGINIVAGFIAEFMDKELEVKLTKGD